MRRHLLPCLLLALASLALPAGAGAATKKLPKLKLQTLSSRADLVTGNDALVAVDFPRPISFSRVEVRLNGRDVTRRFRRQGATRRATAVIDGLHLGANRLSARVDNPRAAAPTELTLFNSSDRGPLFSGPRQTPYFCTTTAAGLAPSSQPSCWAPRQVIWRYRSTDGTFKVLANPEVRPGDIAQTTTRNGETVDYVVRIESGVIDRSIYRWSILAPGGELGRGWNQRLYYTFGGSCSAGYQQGEMPLNAVLPNRPLSQGYAVVSSSLNRFATSCNDLLSAEAAAMIKEHVIEEIGRPPVWTIGQGGSGGSIQIQSIAQNYPGLLDGLLPGASFPDNSLSGSADCKLLQTYFASPEGSTLTNAQRIAIHGLEDPNGCASPANQANLINAELGCNTQVVPPAQIFDPATNPGGIRCSIFDSLVNVYGRDPATGLVRRTDDNIGIQYGLAALQGGAIGLGEFLDLNEDIGGFNENGAVVAQRSVADPAALAAAYRSGRINQGAGGFAGVPIIDVRNYSDVGLNVHQYIYTYETRARMRRTRGTAANQVMWRAQGGQNVNPMQDAALTTLAEWLDRIESDGSDRALAAKVIANKPATAVDACWINGQRVNDPAEVGAPGPCTVAYPPHSLPRLRAGQPLGAPILKCRLRPLSLTDYGAPTPSQVVRLAGIFPNGVCDYAQPGVAQELPAGTWQEFGPRRVVRQRPRSLSLRSVKRGRAARRHAVLTARLGPCPQTMWQRIQFQRFRGGKWRPIGSRIAEAGCTARLRVPLRRAITVRAVSKPSKGYAGTRSKPRRIHP